MNLFKRLRRERLDTTLVTVEHMRTQKRRIHALEDALEELVRLKDGPRDDAYRAAKDAAWDRARELVT